MSYCHVKAEEGTLSEIEHIISACIKGNARAQRALYEKYRTKWFMLALRYGKSKYEAEDILQEGLIQVYKDLHQYDAKKSQFATWSNRVIVHAALKYLKKSNWHNSLLDIANTDIQSDGEMDVLNNLSSKELTLLIQSLPMGYRIVFNMQVIEGYTHVEIAKKLGIEVGTSKSQLSKAKRELRSRLESQLQLTKFSNE